ncbi:hypothetical protein CUS_8024 [Ruminococcus albus 8]|uniref:Uncharacterized protein n=1 Tax=Ruminococcus albus 8 TaxID=246199 RepID=E9SAR2_RUMAL|nr:hypothetical protein CUS_8024 [Ruminococcus albus 8]
MFAGIFLREYNFFKVGLSEREYTIVRLKKERSKIEFTLSYR